MQRVTRRRVLGGLAALPLLPDAARSQTAYPGNQTIRIVVPYAPGGTTDLTGRLLAERLGAVWRTTVVVENIPGAATNIGIDRLAKAPVDGTTIGIITPSLATNPFLYSKMPFDAVKDIQPVSLTVRIPNLLVVRKDLPVNNVAELIAYLQKNPGKLNFGSSGAGSTIHLSGEIFKKATGTDMVHVGYRGSGPALNDLLAGHVDLMFGDIPTVISLARDGRIKGLGVTTATRYPLAPDYPAIAETVPGFDVFSYFGAAVRTGTPPEIVAKIEADCMAAAREPAVRDKLALVMAEAVGSSAREFSDLLRLETDKWGRLIKELNLKIE